MFPIQIAMLEWSIPEFETNPNNVRIFHQLQQESRKTGSRNISQTTKLGE